MKRTRLRRRSSKLQKIYDEVRIPLVQEILEERPWCELRLPGVCLGPSTCVHEVKTRARLGSITNKANCKASCGPCNTNVDHWKFKDYVKEHDLLRNSWMEEAQ